MTPANHETRNDYGTQQGCRRRHEYRRDWCRRLAMVAVLALANPAAAALQAGTFTQYPLRPTTAAAGMQLTRLAVLDASPQSRQWLRDNAAYLTAQQIPVMVLHSSPADSAALLADYQGSGLLLGVAPEPPELMDAVLQRLGVELYPAHDAGGSLHPAPGNPATAAERRSGQRTFGRSRCAATATGCNAARGRDRWDGSLRTRNNWCGCCYAWDRYGSNATVCDRRECSGRRGKSFRKSVADTRQFIWTNTLQTPVFNSYGAHNNVNIFLANRSGIHDNHVFCTHFQKL